MAREARYQVASVGLGHSYDVILIEDLNGPLSITNDAENVVKKVLAWRLAMNNGVPFDRPCRIHYIDIMGRKDELLHDGVKFTGFESVES